MTPKGIPLLEKIVQRFPQTNFLLDHFARTTLDDGPPYTAAQPLMGLSQYPNVYLKLTSRVVEQCHSGKASAATFMPLELEKFGARRMLWGSNYPAHDDTLANILRDSLGVLAGVSPADRERILTGTAQALYPTLA
ncbi:MAG: amidohydrolase [Alphaproteobacteria bacterium]|nr:amidohydrolase [Alphaproteobacteria bacterium]